MRVRFAVLLVVGLLAFGLVWMGGVSPAWASPGSLEEARLLAVEANKPLLVEFYTDWCSWCKVFARDKESDTEVQEAVDGFILYQVNAEKEGVELAKELQIVAYPTFVAQNQAGATLARWYSYTKDQFLTETEEVHSDPTTIEEKISRFETTPTAGDAVRIARYHETIGAYPEAIDHYRVAEELDQDPEADYGMAIFEATYSGQRKDLVPMEDLLAGADRILASPRASEADLVLIALMMQSAGSRAENRELAIPYLQAAVERTAGSEDPEIQEDRTRLLSDYALLVEKDEAKGVALKKESLPEGWMDDPGRLNGFAWWCFLNRVNLDEAFELAQRGVELAESDDDKAQILDTVAEICNAKGDCQNAIVYIQQAIELSPGRDYYKRQLRRFEEALASESGMY